MRIDFHNPSSIKRKASLMAAITISFTLAGTIILPRFFSDSLQAADFTSDLYFFRDGTTLSTSISRQPDSTIPCIIVSDMNQNDVLRGFQDLNDSTYYFDYDGKMQAGTLSINYRNIPNQMANYYFSDQPNSSYGQMKKGRMENYDGTYSIYRLSDGMRVESGFYNDGQNWVYSDENGVLQTGYFMVNQHLYFADDQGTILERNQRAMNAGILEETEDEIQVWIRGKIEKAKKGSKKELFLKAAVPVISKAVYTSGGRNSEENLDCLGFASYVFSKVNPEFTLTLPSCNETMKSWDQYGEIIDPSQLQCGDFIFFRSTFTPSDIYTHASIYIGENKVLSMSHAGIDVVKIEEILDYNGKPAQWTAVRLFLQ
ncbi:NlpC/P60 family protein [Ileibacterium valens]|uniref:NlpC/P60 family protein n=1 Tax=Ileibacterium valens TaxID=1862668 RepID=UPI0035171C52